MEVSKYSITNRLRRCVYKKHFENNSTLEELHHFFDSVCIDVRKETEAIVAKVGTKLVLGGLRPLYIEYRDPNTITGRLMLQRIEALIQSNQEVLLKEVLCEVSILKKND